MIDIFTKIKGFEKRPVMNKFHLKGFTSSQIIGGNGSPTKRLFAIILNG